MKLRLSRRHEVQIATYLLQDFINQVFVYAAMEITEKCLEHFLILDLVYLDELIVYKND